MEIAWKPCPLPSPSTSRLFSSFSLSLASDGEGIGKDKDMMKMSETEETRNITVAHLPSSRFRLPLSPRFLVKEKDSKGWEIKDDGRCCIHLVPWFSLSLFVEDEMGADG